MTKSAKKIACIILACGHSKRFNGNKLFSILNGKPLFLYALEQFCREDFSQVIVVTRYDRIAKSAEEKGFIAVNKDLVDEVSQSIKAAMQELDGDIDGCIFTVCDQPYLTKRTVDEMIKTFLQNPDYIVAPAIKGEIGNPVLFPKSFFHQLNSLTGDTGGKKIVKSNMNKLITIEYSDPMELNDIDTKEDIKLR